MKDLFIVSSIKKPEDILYNFPFFKSKENKKSKKIRSKKMKQFTLYVGLLDKDSKKQEISDKNAKEIISNIVGDCTISEASGYYTHSNGDKIEEKSFRVEVLFKTLDEIKIIASILKRKLNQESIALSVQEIESELV